jgi:cytochrome c oxidase assembly protein subunit 15
MTISTLDPSDFVAPDSGGARRATPVWIGGWLWAVAALVILMVVVGGATRLTGSGLSITQWRPVSGALPPLSHADWLTEFARYRASPQSQLENAGMGLADFKFIFWWEWTHRQLGRFIGLVFAGGFLFGLGTRQFRFGLGAKLAGMGLLLGFQGLIGWLMVASGLKAGMTAVEPVDLAAHLLLASLFLATLVALATSLGQEGALPARTVGPRGAAILSKLLVGLVLAQLTLGALVAGSHAGLIYNTWPSMDGRLVPPFGELFSSTPWWASFFENVTLVQFDHRMLAYVVLALALGNAAIWSRRSYARAPRRLAFTLAGLALAQVALGIATLVWVVPLALALGHQLLAMFVLSAAVRLAVLGRAAAPVPAVLGSLAESPLAAHVATR